MIASCVPPPPLPLALSSASVDVAEMASVPEHDGWLGEAERRWLSTRRVPKRRADWRLGRWVAKSAVLAALGRPGLRRDQIEILATEGGAPAIRFLRPGGMPHLSLSLSHAGGIGFAAVLPGQVRLGCDVEGVAPRSAAFVADYFTSSERSWIDGDGDGDGDGAQRDLRATLLWSAKESALKALGEGLRLDTRTVEVEGEVPPVSGRWAPLTVRHGGAPFRGWWRRTPGFVWTLVVGDDGGA